MTYLPATMEVWGSQPQTPKFLTFSQKPKKEEGKHRGKGRSTEGEIGGKDFKVEGADEEAEAAYTWFSKRSVGHHKSLTTNAHMPARNFSSESAATYIQKLYRARLATKAVKKALCRTWCKKADATPVRR